MHCISARLFRLISVFGLSTLVLTGCNTSSAVSPAQHHVPSPVTDHGMTLVWGHDVKTEAMAMIGDSAHYCYLDMYELADSDILAALAAARRRGVDVRVIVDVTEHHSQTEGVPQLRQAGVPVASLRIPRGISHIKLLLADGAHGGVLIGGMNFGQRSWDNNDASVHLPQPNPSFESVFQWDWLRAHGQPAEKPAVELPLLDERQTEEHVVAAIQNARQTVYLEAFNLSDWAVLSALKAAGRRGVLVEVLLDPNQSQNERSASELRGAGVTVRFYRPYQQEWMHAKILDVDHGATFIIGSANFSHQAYTYNHEGVIELHQVPAFDQALESNLSVQIARGTDYPRRHPSTQSQEEGA